MCHRVFYFYVCVFFNFELPYTFATTMFNNNNKKKKKKKKKNVVQKKAEKKLKYKSLFIEIQRM